MIIIARRRSTMIKMIYYGNSYLTMLVHLDTYHNCLWRQGLYLLSERYLIGKKDRDYPTSHADVDVTSDPTKRNKQNTLKIKEKSYKHYRKRSLNKMNRILQKLENAFILSIWKVSLHYLRRRISHKNNQANP